MSQALRLRALHKTFRAGIDGCTAHVHALRGVDLDVDEGELVAIAGAAGAGKTTLLLCAAGMLVPDAGIAMLPGAGPLPAARGRAVYLSARPPEGRSPATRVHEAAGYRHRSPASPLLARQAAASGGGPTRVLLADDLDAVVVADLPGVVKRLRGIADGGVAVVVAVRYGAATPALDALSTAGARIVRLFFGRVVDAVPAAQRGAASLELRIAPAGAASRLRAAGMPLRDDGDIVRVPLEGTSAEEILARCLALRVAVTASRVVRDGAAGDSPR